MVKYKWTKADSTCVLRIRHPKLFDPRSFRVLRTGKGTQLTLGCPKGKWMPKKRFKTRAGKMVTGKCKVPMLVQRIRKPLKKGACRYPVAKYKYLAKRKITL